MAYTLDSFTLKAYTLACRTLANRGGAAAVVSPPTAPGLEWSDGERLEWNTNAGPLDWETGFRTMDWSVTQ